MVRSVPWLAARAELCQQARQSTARSRARLTSKLAVLFCPCMYLYRVCLKMSRGFGLYIQCAECA
jgi:hypothetical protein